VSSTLRIDRSNAKSTILKRWITEGFFYPGDDVCEVVIDGTSEIVKWETTYHNDIAGVVWASFVKATKLGKMAVFWSIQHRAAAAIHERPLSGMRKFAVQW